VAQVGRISGPLLEANLLRQGIANGTQANLSFKNSNSDPTLLKIDVVNNRIGIAGAESPANRVEVLGTVKADDALSTTAFLGNLELTTNNINTDSGDIYLDAGEHIQVSNLETEQFYITDNYISTKDTNTDIDLKFNGTGGLEVKSNLEVFGNLNAGGNITLDGNITFGDADTDSVDFNSDVNSNIIPDQTDTYSLGNVYKSWDALDSKLVNGQELNTSTISVNGIDLTNRAGNIIYVSKEGADTNVGDHPNGSLLTIEEAIARVDSSTAGPVTIRIAPGVYEENLPLVIPSDVSVQGIDIRNVVVKPAAGSESKDVFHVDDNTTISDLTIKDYQYDSGNNTGYAFRFSPNAVITNRSPYIQNVTVITKGTLSLDWAEIANTLLGIGVGGISSGDIYDFFTSTNSASGDQQGDLTGNGTITPGDGTAAVQINSDRDNAETLYPGQAAHWNAMEVALIAEYNADPASFESLIDTSDPRGFAAGDAGKGAWIDGAELDSASIEASMLFHAATFITPGVDAITMTNGVRVEWLNSFTYFANRGLYAVNGSTGRTAYGTTNYGAEVRSIGSASVYGNYGAVVDGSDTLMYLIQHNFGYIGSGKFADNDDSRAIQSQEVTELNSGKINFVTTDHTGGFRIGDNFFVDFETGNTTINIDTLTVNQFNALRVNTGADTTVIDGAFIDTGNLILANNIIQSDSGDLSLASATGKINLQDNTNITGNLGISSDFSFGGALNIGGDQTTDSLTFNTSLDQDFNPHQHQIFSLGSFAKKWLQAHLDKIETPDINIYDNVIETTQTDADLELRAAGTGNIRITDSARFTNNVTINGTTNILDNLSITDSVLPIVGDVNQTGNFTISEDADIGQNINVGASAQFEEILVDDNFITTTTTNTPLELRAAGTGTVNLQDSVNVTNNLTASDTTATNANITLNATTDNANIGSIEINDNNISATSTDSNLILNADDEVRVSGTDVVFGQDLTVAGLTDLLGSTTSITGSLNHTGDRGTNTGSDFTLNGEFTVDNVYIEDNFITTTSGNLILQATGDIDIDSNNVEIANDLDVDGVTNLDVTNIDGTITHVGDRTQTGDYNIGGELTVDNVYIEDNFITTTSGNLVLKHPSPDLEIISESLSMIVSNTAVNSSRVSFRNNGSQSSTTVFDANQINQIRIGSQFPVVLGADYIKITFPDSTYAILKEGGRTISQQVTYVVGEVIYHNTISKSWGGQYVTIENGPIANYTSTNSTRDIIVNSNDVEIAQDVTISGTTSLQSTNFTGTVTRYGNTSQTGNLDIAGEIAIDNILIKDNLITTTSNVPIGIINPDLELRTSGTGEVVIDPSDTVTIDNNLTVGGTLTYQGALTINGDVALLGNTQDGSLTVTDNFDVTGTLDISSQAQFEDIRIEDNFITTTQSSSDLELRASGTGEVLVPNNNVQVNNNLFTASISTGDITVNNDLVLNEIVIPTSIIEIDDNFISTRVSDADLELRATGDVVVQANNIIEQNLTVNGNTNLQDTTINGTLTQVGNTTQTGNYDLTGILTVGMLTMSKPLQAGDINISGNVVETIVNNSNLDLRAAGTGQVRLQENVDIQNNLTVRNFNVDSINVANSVDLEVAQLSTNIQFEDNVITTTGTTSYSVGGTLRLNEVAKITDAPDLETDDYNKIWFYDDDTSSYQLNQDATTDRVMFWTPQPNTVDYGVQIGDYFSITKGSTIFVGQITGLVGVLSIDAWAYTEVFKTGYINNNVDSVTEVTVTVGTSLVSVSNLELRAAGTGSVLLQNIEINNDIIGTNIAEGDTLTLTLAPTEDLIIDSTESLQIPKGTTAQRIQAQDTFLDGGAALNSSTILDGGDATTVFGASDTIYNSGSALLTTSGNIGDIRFNTDDNVFEGTGLTSTISLGGVYSEDRQTSVTADTATNSIQFVVNSTTVGEVNSNGLSIHSIQTDDILLDNNIISTTVSNSNLDLRANGTGELVLDDLSFKNNVIKDNGNNLIIKNTGFGYTKFSGTAGVVVPSGGTFGALAVPPQVGDTRWNTNRRQLESWDGSAYISSAGVAGVISADEFDDLLLEYTIIFG